MADNVLNRRVISDRGVVTYRLLSRLLNCHVNEAKKHLETFRTKNSENCHATYIVHGILGAPALNGHAKLSSEQDDMLVDGQETKEEAHIEETPRTVFELVQEEELEACKARFEQVTSVFVYSLERKRLNDISLIIPANKLIETDEKCKRNTAASEKGAKFGVIQLPPRKGGAKKKGPLPPTSPMPVRPSKDAKPVKEDKKPVIKKDEKPSIKTEEKPQIGKDIKGKGKATTSEEMDLMSWDDAAEEEMLKMEQEAADEPLKPTEASMEVDTPASKKRIRKKRIVKKTVRDEKGNRRTEEVEESYSEDEDAEEKKPVINKASSSNAAPAAKKPAAPPAKKPAGPPQGNAPKAKPKADESGQTSLKGFFGKASSKKK